MVVVYSRGAMDIYFDDMTKKVLTVRIVISDLIPLLDGGRAFVGVAAATGEAFEAHELISFKFEQLGIKGTLIGCKSSTSLLSAVNSFFCIVFVFPACNAICFSFS